jgi:Holliday junction DNA helicase RuvA
MIASLRGILFEKTPEHAIVDVNGVGYSARITSRCYSLLPSTGEEVFLHTKMIVRENDIRLFAFAEAQERNAFGILIDIPSIGPSTALSILTTLSLKDLSEVIISEDPDRLTQVPGIGKKSAKKLAIELKDRFDRLFDEPFIPIQLSPEDKNTQNDAKLIRDALASLGFSRPEIDQKLKEMPELVGQPIETVIRTFLKNTHQRGM